MYNAQAESYSNGARSPFVGGTGFSYPKGWSRFNQLYSEIADATPTDEPFVVSRLLGQLPSIAHLAPKTQSEILRVVVRDMVRLTAPSDGLVRVKGGCYRWVCRCAAAA